MKRSCGAWYFFFMTASRLTITLLLFARRDLSKPVATTLFYILRAWNNIEFIGLYNSSNGMLRYIEHLKVTIRETEITQIHFKVHAKYFEEVRIQFDIRVGLIFVFACSAHYCSYEVVVLPFANRHSIRQVVLRAVSYI